MGTACQEMGVTRAGYLLNWLTNMLPYTAKDPVWLKVDSPIKERKLSFKYKRYTNTCLTRLKTHTHTHTQHTHNWT